MFKTEFIEEECIPIIITNSLYTKFSVVIGKKTISAFDTKQSYAFDKKEAAEEEENAQMFL